MHDESVQVVAGLAAGTVYALLGLGIVLAHRASRVVNVGQAALATLSAYGCSSLVTHGWSFWPAFGAAVVLSFVGGGALHAFLVRPLQGGPLLAATGVTAGLLLAADGLERWVWGGAPRPLPLPVAGGRVTVAGLHAGRRDLAVVGIGLAAVAVVLALARTRIGLGLRAAAANPESARYAGVPVGALGDVAWGVAAALGAVAGILAAAEFGLEPRMLRLGLLFALAAAALAGLRSVPTVVPAGLGLGIAVELVGRHVHWLHGRLPPVLGAALVVVGLVVRRP